MTKTVLDVMMDAIVTPRCDECGASVEHEVPASQRLNGPHLCYRCKLLSEQAVQRGFRECREAEGKRRSVHIVKLPDGFC